MTRGGQPDRRRGRERPPGRARPRSSSGCGASSSWRTTCSSSCCRRPRCSRATRRSPRAATRPSRSAATSTPSRRLGRGRVGVMLGDVASHGFSAALVMALVMSAAGHPRGGVDHAGRNAHARCSTAWRPSSPTTEMYFSVFYGVLDPLSRPALLRQRRTSATRSGCRGSATPSGSRPPRRRWAWRPRAASSGARCPGPSSTTCSCSGPTAWWTRGTTRESRSASSGCSTRCARAASETPEAIVHGGAGGGRRVRVAPDRRPHAAGAADLAVPRAKRRLGQHFLTDPRHTRRGSPTRSAPGPTTPCWRSAPGPAASRRRWRSGRGGWSPSRRTATWCPRSAQRFPAATIVEGDALDVDWHGAGRAAVSRRRQHPLQHHVAAASTRRSMPPRAGRIVFLVQKEVADRVDGRRPGTPTYGALSVGRPVGGPGRAALHRAGRRIPSAAQGGLGGAAPDPAWPTRWCRPAEQASFRRLVVGLFGFRRKQMAARGCAS